MYRRAIVNFCGAISIDNFDFFMIRSNEVALKSLYSYVSVADVAIANCYIVGDARKPLGSISVGRVIERGVDVEDVHEGSRAIAFPIHSPQFLYTDGALQDVVVTERDLVKVAELEGYNDLEALLIAALSVTKDLIEYIKGRDVILIGNDLSLTTFAFYASRYSSRIGLVPSLSKGLDIDVGEHVSLYKKHREFDTIVIATADPSGLCLAIKNLSKDRGSTLIVYPYIHQILNSICIRSRDIEMKTLRLGDIGIGIEVFEAVKERLIRRVSVVSIDELQKGVSKPLIVKLG